MTDQQDGPRIVDDLMTTEPIVIGPSDRVGGARDLMLTLGIHGIPVESAGRTVGIVTSSDLVDDWPDDELISAVMTTCPYTVDAEADLREAADLMIERHVHHLLVERAGRVIGILSSLDLLRALR